MGISSMPSACRLCPGIKSAAEAANVVATGEEHDLAAVGAEDAICFVEELASAVLPEASGEHRASAVLAAD